MAIEIKMPNILVVEGKDEEHFFSAFIDHLRLKGIQVMGIGGKTNLRENLKALKSSPYFTNIISLGILRDANSNPSCAFQSVRDALEAVGLQAPERPFVSAGNSPKVAVMILPNYDETGSLEDLCLKAVVSDPAMDCVKQYFQCLEEKSHLPRNISKAKIQAFLASRPDAGKRLGEAAQAGFWPWDNEAFEHVRKFFSTTF